MDALVSAAASGAGRGRPEDDDDEGYSDDDFDTVAQSPKRRTAEEVLLPTRTTSPIDTSRGARAGAGRAGGGRRPMEGRRGSRSSRSSRGALGRSTDALAARSSEATKQLMRTSLAAHMNSLSGVGKKDKKKTKPKPRPRFHKERMNNLANPKVVPKTKFSREADKKNCKFKPRISAKSRGMIQTSDDPNAFIYRMEAAHNTTRRDMDKRRGEEAYNDRNDKKVCPICKMEQSYKEWKDNIKKCERCNASYRPKKTWAEVQADFLKRLEDGETKKKKGLEKLERKVVRAQTRVRKKVYDKETGKIIRQTAKTQNWKTVRSGFLKRMEEDAENRKKKMSLLDAAMGALDPECTFKPKISKSRRPTSARSMGSPRSSS